MRQLLQSSAKWYTGITGRLYNTRFGDEMFQVIVPKKEAKDVWRTNHEEMGHPSSERTLSALRLHCYWPRMPLDVQEWTDACLQCVCAKAGPEVRTPLMSITTSYPFEVVGLDYLSLECPEDLYPYILL